MNKPNLTRILILAVTFISFTVVSSCTKVGKNLYFTLSMQTGSANVTIPVTPLTSGTAVFGPTSNSYNVDSFIKAQTGTLLGVQNITSVKITSCVLMINNATKANNLQNLKSGGGKLRDAITVPLNCTLQFTFKVIVQG